MPSPCGSELDITISTAKSGAHRHPDGLRDRQTNAVRALRLHPERAETLQLTSTVLDQGLEGSLMKFLALRRSNPELGSRTHVVESISVEGEQYLGVTRFGELHDALCDVFVFESAS